MTRVRSWWPPNRGDRVVLVALGTLVTAGVGLRLLAMAAQRPAFLGYIDSVLYIGAARGYLFDDPARPAGYPLFLWISHLPGGSLSLTILLQHALGVATALLLFLTVRRVASAAWALVPAAVILLAGPQLLLEHSPMSEPLFAFLVAATLYCAARALEERPVFWGSLAGGLAAAAACVRSVGLLLPLILGVWLVAATPGALGRRVRIGGAALLCAWLLLATYVVAAKHAAGYVGPGLTRIGGLTLYARAMTFADCGHFTPPQGTRDLCERRPPSRRPGPFYYSIANSSPPARAYGSLERIRPEQNRELVSFAQAAIVHQPGDYLRDVGADLTRFWSSSSHARQFSGESYDLLQGSLLATPSPNLGRFVSSWYGTGTVVAHDGPLATLRGYERHTRLEGPAFVLLVLLALVGAPLARGRRLALSILLVCVSALTLMAPVATAFYTARFVVPGYGPLAAAGALGAASLWGRVAAGLARRRSVELPERVAA